MLRTTIGKQTPDHCAMHRMLYGLPCYNVIMSTIRRECIFQHCDNGNLDNVDIPASTGLVSHDAECKPHDAALEPHGAKHEPHDAELEPHDAELEITQRKYLLRKNAIAHRKTVSDEERSHAALALAHAAEPLIEQIVNDHAWQPTMASSSDTASSHAALSHASSSDTASSGTVTVAAYVSMGSEIAMGPLLESLLHAGLRVLVPRLGSGLDVGWSELTNMTSLHDVAADGIHRSRRPQEPDTTVLPPEALREAVIIIVPALAVDAAGIRLGRGGGWYDRALSWRAPRARVIAVCWPWETAYDVLPAQAHDVPVDGVITPEGYVPRPL